MSILRIFSVFSITLIFSACDIEEFSDNPNVPTTAPLSTLLPPTQKALGDFQGGRIFRYSNIFAQQLRGVDGQEALIENYNPDELFVGNIWSDGYVSAMTNLRIIIDRADAEGSPHYAGVARVQMGTCLGILADLWGDVPYSQALQGAVFPNPIYDSQESIYNTIDAILAQAIEDLNQPSSVFTPGPDDLIYAGNLINWSRAAGILRVRYALHTTKVDPQAANRALELQQMASFESAASDFTYPYLGTGTDVNPISSFYSNTPHANIDPSFTDLLADLGDPRAPSMFASIPFSGGQRKPGAYFSSPASPVVLCGYMEEKFLRAEIAARTQPGSAATAQAELTEAITISMQQVSNSVIPSGDVEAYISERATLNGDFNHDLEIILTQKYIAMFTTPETWTDYRRTGIPALTPNAGGASSSNPNGEIPRRLIYPQSERLRNPNFPSPTPTMQDRFWWDQ